MGAKKKDSKKKGQDPPKVNPELLGFDIKINSFGEIESTYSIDKLNEFLGKNLKDKKIKKSGREKDSNKGS